MAVELQQTLQQIKSEREHKMPLVADAKSETRKSFVRPSSGLFAM